MKLPVIRESYALNIFILVFSLFVAWFGLFFGLAHLLAPSDHTPSREGTWGVVFCILLCLVGILFLFIAFLAIQGIVYKIRHRHPGETHQ